MWRLFLIHLLQKGTWGMLVSLSAGNKTFEDDSGDIKYGWKFFWETTFFILNFSENLYKPKCKTLAALTEMSGCKLYVLCVSSHRVLGGVGDEQRHSRISPVILHGRPHPGPAAPSSSGGRGGHGGRAGARAVLILNSQRRHGEDPVGCPARVKPQQLLLWQVGGGGTRSLFSGGEEPDPDPWPPSSCGWDWKNEQMQQL